MPHHVPSEFADGEHAVALYFRRMDYDTQGKISTLHARVRDRREHPTLAGWYADRLINKPESPYIVMIYCSEGRAK